MTDQPSAPSPNEPIRIFVSYAREDRRWLIEEEKFQLIPFLADSLRWSGANFWSDGRLRPGDQWKYEIEAEIDQSEIALLLVTQAFLNSVYIRENEMPRINARAERKELIVVPVLVERCVLKGYPFLTDRQMVPARPPLMSHTTNEYTWSEVKSEILEGLIGTVDRVRQLRAERLQLIEATAEQERLDAERKRLAEDTEREAEVARLERERLAVEAAAMAEVTRLNRERVALEAEEAEAREKAETLERQQLKEEAERKRLAELEKAEAIRLQKKRLAEEAAANAEAARLEEERQAREAAEAVAKEKAEAIERQKLDDERRQAEIVRLADEKLQFSERINAAMRPRIGHSFDAMAEVERQSLSMAHESPLRQNAMYRKHATRASQARIIFLLDRSASMSLPLNGGTRMDALNEVVRDLLSHLIARSMRGEDITSRYRVAICVYSDQADDLLGGFLPIPELAWRGAPTLEAHPSAASSGVCEAFQWALVLLRADMEQDGDQPAPTLIHLTDGAFPADAADPEPIAQKIRALQNDDGGVLIQTIFFGSDFTAKALPALTDWPGLQDEVELPIPQACKLFRMSSKLPEPRAQDLSDQGYSLRVGAGMLFPATGFSSDLAAFPIPPWT